MRGTDMRNFHFPGRSPVYAENGMCATSHPLAAMAAVDILKAGGNAMDAAIAGAVLLGVCEPQMTGIGGDCFVLFSPAGSEDIHALNGSGVAPMAANAEALRQEGHKTIPLRSAHAVTIPTAMDGFCRLSEDWGKLGIDRILAPSIHYFEEGVPIAPRVAFDLQDLTEALNPTARGMYLIDGAAPKTGQRLRSVEQAAALRAVAQKGRDGFYKGAVAEDMVASLNAVGGVHTLDDFANATSFYTDPISTAYGPVDLYEHPPNGQGATANLILNIVSQFDQSKMDPNGAERVHLFAEAAKLAYDARNRFIADPDQTTRLGHMLDMDTARKLAALIDPNKAMTSATQLSEAVHKDTIYITVVDKDRMAVSLIYSIFHGYGSGIASEKYGILFQNRGAGFNLIEGHPNELGGGKRPMHTIIPGMLKRDGSVLMPFGVMGGQYQPNGHAHVVSNMIDFGMDVQTAIDAPRSFAEGNVLKLEDGIDAATAQTLADMGHTIERPKGPIGGGQAIMIEDDFLIGGSDPRKDGCAIGY